MIYVFNSWDNSLTFPSFYYFHSIDIYLRFSIKKKCKTITWKKKYSDCQKQWNNWEETSSSFERNIPPHETFELFLADEEMGRICFGSLNYARLKGEQNFIMTLDTFKSTYCYSSYKRMEWTSKIENVMVTKRRLTKFACLVHDE